MGPRAPAALMSATRPPDAAPLSWRLLRRLARLPRFRGQGRAFRLASRFVRPLPLAVPITIDGDIPLLADLDEEIGARLYLHGLHEPDVTPAFTAAVGPGDVVIDAGANIGYYTLLAARRCGPQGLVAAFEPCPPSFERLQRNVQFAGFANVRAFAQALVEAPGTLRLGCASPRRSADARLLADAAAEPAGAAWEIEGVRLDDCLAAGRFPPPTVLKVDVEGAEEKVLRGATQALSAGRPVLFLEHNPAAARACGSYPAATLAWLAENFGYAFHWLTQQGLVAFAEADDREFGNVLGVIPELHDNRLARCTEAAARAPERFYCPLWPAP